MKHRITIKVAGKPLLEAADLTLPQKIIRWLFGDFQQIYLMNPGVSIEKIEVKEIGENEHERIRSAA